VPAGAPASVDPRKEVTDFVRTREIAANTLPAMQALATEIGQEVGKFADLSDVPQGQISNVRNDMYLNSEAMRLINKSGQPAVSGTDKDILKTYNRELDNATKFIPTWVKVAVALALGLGTMVGWKRIVVTVGEKIGKDHLTYAQGASAELVAMTTIGAADMFGLPVSTTHVLSSGVAGTMAANGSGLQWGTIRNMIMAWVLTLPASIILSGGLFYLFRQVF
jgi:inorganic phosphate transporter, PiT family